MTELIVGLAVPLGTALIVCLFKFVKWLIRYSQAVSLDNQVSLNNHLDHHEKRVEPKINKIAEDVAYIRGKLDGS